MLLLSAKNCGTIENFGGDSRQEFHPAVSDNPNPFKIHMQEGKCT
jgi:hypothetical protein